MATKTRRIRKAPAQVLSSISESIKGVGNDGEVHRLTDIPQPTITRLRNKQILNPSIDLLVDLSKGINKPLNQLVGCE